MGNISDRDKKIIIFLLILMITILPYVFYIKDAKQETEALNIEIGTLQARYDELKAMDEKRDQYIEDTKKMNDERDAIIASFPADIRPENYTMFLLQTEYSSPVQLNEETGEVELMYPLVFSAVSYGQNIETPISSENTDTGYVALTNTSTVEYRCYYGGLKYMLEYLMEYEDPMIYTQIVMTYDQETGVISGAMDLAQYAVSGEGRTLEPVDFTIQVGGQNVDLDLDNMNPELRGNEEVGVFGPVVTNEVDEEEEVVAEETVEE